MDSVKHPNVRPQPPVETTLFGRYEILFKIARGGMATVYLARMRGPERFEKQLALKMLHESFLDDEESVRAFLDEARIAARIQHPNVVPLFEMGEVDERYYIAMEYVHGQSLAELLRSAVRKNVTLPWAYHVRMAASVARGLNAAHDLRDAAGRPLGVIHRDVSPQNVLVSYDGHVKVTDFGIAFAAERVSKTGTGVVKGKVAYMSPEQVRAEVLDRRSDLFSLGVILHEALTGRRLFRRESDIATAQAIAACDVVSPRSIVPALPPIVDEVVMRMLAPERGDRYPSAAALADDLESLLVSAEEPVTESNLTAVMDRLFTVERRQREERIGLYAADHRAPPVASAAAPASIPVGGEPTVVDAAGPRRAGSPGGLSLVAIVALAVVAISVAYLAFRPRGSTSAQPPSTTQPEVLGPDAAASSERPSPTVRVRIDVAPDAAKAVVIFRGVSHPGNRFRTRLSRRGKVEPLEIKAPGYETKRIRVDPRGDVEQRVTLLRVPPPRRRVRRPSRRPRHRPMAVLREPMWSK